MRKLACLRCGTKMEFLMCEKFQKGDMGPWVGNINFSMQGGFEMEVYSCSRCGELEFFLPDVPQEEIEIPEEIDQPQFDGDISIVCVNHAGIPQVRCRACGTLHDFDYPQCPKCGKTV